ncbi:MAG: glycosyltransferase [Saprospiraceae bacterium]|nr:glycosyltransferase [Saprospiraceae bacterium]MBK9677705.1 glycosyltransferase [Saprospiraceae bacterium]MBK9932527.1 glycosyltransferase [Saprospiraceae bacterium]
MAHIYHIPTWWPSEQKPFNGIFILNLIDALAEANPNHQHTIAIHSTNLQWISPRNIIKDTINFFNKDHAVLRNEANIHYKVIKRTIGMNPITGINYIQSLTNKHLKVIESLPSKPDLIHAHVSYPSLLIAQVISKKYNIPYILTEHSTRFPDRRFEDFGYSHDQIAEAFIACSATIAVSQHLGNKFLCYGKVADYIIPNFITWQKPVLTPKAPPFTFLIIALLNDPRKKIGLVIYALSLVLKNVSEVQLIIAGEGSMKKDLMKQSAALGLNDHITWFGLTDEPKKMNLLIRSHALIISSEEETFGITAIEAHSYGLPVLSTRCGGPEEIIQPFNGILVEKNDMNKMAEGMIYMINHLQSFEAQHIQSASYAIYGKDKITSQYLKVYANILDHSKTH